jgi:hypothetical protein
MTALQISRQNIDEPRDLFGDVRIPDIRSLIPSNNTFEPPSNWYAIEDRPVLTHASLLGIPVADVPKSGNVSLPFESSYWEIRCNPFSSYTSDQEDYCEIALNPGGESYCVLLHGPYGYDKTWPITKTDSQSFQGYSTKVVRFYNEAASWRALEPSFTLTF